MSEWQARPRHPRSLTDEEKARALAAMDALEQLNQQILARHGVARFTPAFSELLHASQDERMRQLA